MTIINEAVAVVVGYLLGSIPTAYLVVRLATRQDIRKLGGGNVGGLNTLREVGAWAATTVAIIDLGKGAAAVAIAHWLLGVPPLFVLLAGLAAVIGHNWMVWLKFSGGKGAGATIGALAVAMPLYDYWQGLAIFLGIIAIVLMVTRNIALSTGSALVFLPLITWLGTKSITATIVAICLGLVILIKFLPTAIKSWSQSKTAGDFIFDRGQKGGKRGG